MSHDVFTGSAGADASTIAGLTHTLDEPIPYWPVDGREHDELNAKAVAVWTALIFGSLLALAVSLKLIISVAYEVAQLVGLA